MSQKTNCCGFYCRHIFIEYDLWLIAAVIEGSALGPGRIVRDMGLSYRVCERILWFTESTGSSVSLFKDKFYICFVPRSFHTFEHPFIPYRCRTACGYIILEPWWSITMKCLMFLPLWNGFSMKTRDHFIVTICF